MENKKQRVILSSPHTPKNMSNTSSAHRGILPAGFLAVLLFWFSASLASAIGIVPLADAGPDQTVTADLTGYGTAVLDGSATWDPDSIEDGTLDYLWTNSITAFGVNPTVRLSVGTHVITLYVTDLQGNVGTDTVVVTVLVNPDAGPVINTTAQDQTVECDGLGDNAALLAWVASHGGAAASSPNGPVTWTDNYSPGNFVFDSAGCAAGHVTVTFTATDPLEKTATTTATFRVVDTMPPVLVWYVDGQIVDDAAVYALTKKDLPITVRVAAVDLCGGATLSKFSSSSLDGSSKVRFTGDTFTITQASVGAVVRFTSAALDDCGNAGAEEWLTINIVQEGKGKPGAKACEGLASAAGCTYDRLADVPAYQPGNPAARNKHR